MLMVNKDDNAQMIKEKEIIINEQRNHLKHLPIETILYQQFTAKGKTPSQEEWSLIEEQVMEIYPHFCDFMKAHASKLNDKEYKTCVLVRAGLKPKSISSLLNVGPSYVSNIRSEMLQTLFGLSGTPKSFDQRIKEIC